MERDDILITAPQLRQRYGGRSDMWLWRLLRDQSSSFPRPVIINGRRYFSLSALQSWEISQASCGVSDAPRRGAERSPVRSTRDLRHAG